MLSATLPAALPEVGVLNQRAIATLVGGAPLHDASGKHTGARHLRGGRAKVRAVWSLATRTATRSHPVIHAFSHRVLARGTAPKGAMTAAMRTCRTILNAMGNTRTPWTARVHHGPVPDPAR